MCAVSIVSWGTPISRQRLLRACRYYAHVLLTNLLSFRPGRADLAIACDMYAFASISGSLNLGP